MSIKPWNSHTFQFLPEVPSGENPEVIPSSRWEFTETCLCSLCRRFSCRYPVTALAAVCSQPCRGETQHGDRWMEPHVSMSEPCSCSPCSLALPASSLCPLCCLPAPSPLEEAVSHLSPASASSTRNWSGSWALKYQQGTGMLVSLISAAALTGKQNGGVRWERESAEGVGGGLTSGVRGWRKIREQKKRKDLGEMGKEQNSGKKSEHK